MIGKTATPTRIVTIVLLCYWLALFVGTHSPTLPVGFRHGWDKAAHFASYAGLAFLLACAFGARARRSILADLSLLAVVALYGVVDELLQMAVPGRSAELWDWAADVCGAAIGLLAYRVLHAAARFVRSSTPPIASRDSVL